MRIQIASVSDVEYGTSAKGKRFGKVTVEYISAGKKYNKTLTQYSDAYATLKDALPDQVFSLDLEKNGNFTEWKNVKSEDDNGQDAAAPEAVEKTKSKSAGSYGTSVRKASSVADPRETAVERAVKQGIISRQACINSALEYLALQRMPEGVAGGPSVEGVLAVAEQFLNFVQGNVEVTKEDVAE